MAHVDSPNDQDGRPAARRRSVGLVESLIGGIVCLAAAAGMLVIGQGDVCLAIPLLVAFGLGFLYQAYRARTNA